MNTRQPSRNASSNIFDTLFQSYMNPRPVPASSSRQGPISRPSTNATPAAQVNAPSLVATMNALHETMIGYNNNIHTYNENIRIFLEIIEANQTNATSVANTDLSANLRSSQQTPREPTTSTQSDTNNVFNNVFSGMFQQQPFRNLNANVRTAYYTTIPSNVSDAVIRPTTEQINNALENIIYNAGQHNSSTCPITLEEFVEGNTIRRIKHCGHIFSSQAINNWFNRHVRCPVCRYDIREYRQQVTSDVSMNIIDNEEEQQLSDELIQGVTHQIASIFENFANNMLATTDSSSNFIYQIDIPIITRYEEDISDDLDVE